MLLLNAVYCYTVYEHRMLLFSPYPPTLWHYRRLSNVESESEESREGLVEGGRERASEEGR
eukprot:1452862-Rhodomonas_salina.1